MYRDQKDHMFGHKMETEHKTAVGIRKWVATIEWEGEMVMDSLDGLVKIQVGGDNLSFLIYYFVDVCRRCIIIQKSLL